MYYTICQGWLHCFREPSKYIPIDKPHALISESDFVNYKTHTPDESIKKEYDFIYSCPKVNKDSSCTDWVSYNKNWELALKCLPILCEKYKLKGLLIGREGCDIPEGCKPYITTTGWLNYDEVKKYYQQSKFQFIPNQRDASPRVITEGMCYGLPCLMNYNILGGWKYIDENKTGVFFKDENDIEPAIEKLLEKMPTYNVRQYIIDNYGPINSGKKLKEFLFANFKNKLNIKDCNYITLRSPITDF
jgi:glycosyltransferase involved in cell wall biosynthesis